MEEKKEFKTRKNAQISEMVYSKVPPQAPELEGAVLGACMLERDTFENIYGIIFTEEMFYLDKNKIVYKAILNLNKEKTPIDLLTVTDKLRKTSELELVGGAWYLTELTMSVISSAHTEAHARIIAEKYFAREVIIKCSQIISRCYEDAEDIFDIMEDVKKVHAITDNLESEKELTLVELATEIAMDIAEMKENRTELVGYDTGFQELNILTNGIKESETIVIAARPGFGKTAIAINIAIAASKTKFKKCDVIIFSIEATAKELMKRFIACELEYEYDKIIKGTLSDQEFANFTKRINEFENMNIKIVDNLKHWSAISNRIKKESRKNRNFKIAIIDYIQLVRTNFKTQSRAYEIAELTGECKQLAKDCNISIIELAQLNRDSVKDKREPELSDLKDSGGIEQDANTVWFIHHQLSQDKEDSFGKPINEILLLVRKNRNGKCGRVELRFAGEFQKFMSINDYEQNKLNYETHYNPLAGISNGYQSRGTIISDSEWES